MVDLVVEEGPIVVDRAVKMDGPAHSGFVGPGLKSTGKKRAAKSRLEPSPVRALGLSGRPGFFINKTFLKQ
jgi:hypothetical protein